MGEGKKRGIRWGQQELGTQIYEDDVGFSVTSYIWYMPRNLINHELVSGRKEG